MAKGTVGHPVTRAPPSWTSMQCHGCPHAQPCSVLKQQREQEAGQRMLQGK